MMTTWKYRKDGEKWVVGKWMHERMRVCANGDVINFGENGIDHLVSELYTFDTEWAAESHARFCNRLEGWGER